MNTLGYRCTGLNGLSFMLLVDGQPLGQLLGASPVEEIPYGAFIEDDLPRGWGAGDPFYRGHEAEVRTVAICSCLVEDCGCILCRVVREGETVAFRDFWGAEVGGKEFRFSRDNYETVVAEMVAQARAYRDNQVPAGGRRPRKSSNAKKKPRPGKRRKSSGGSA